MNLIFFLGLAQVVWVWMNLTGSWVKGYDWRDSFKQLGLADRRNRRSSCLGHGSNSVSNSPPQYVSLSH